MQEVSARASNPGHPEPGTGLYLAMCTKLLDLQKAGAPASPIAAHGTCKHSPAFEKIKPLR